MEQFKDEVREVRWRWFEHELRRQDKNDGQRMLEMEMETTEESWM